MSHTITDGFLEELEALHAAGSANWTLDYNLTDTIKSISIESPTGSVVAAVESEEGEWDDEMERLVDANLNLAVAARNALPLLLAEIRRLRGPDVPIVVVN
jgi:hypothetical protein